MDIALYILLMVLFISDLSIVGLVMGRSLISRKSWKADAVTANHAFDTSPYGIAVTVQEVLMAVICLRNLWCAPPSNIGVFSFAPSSLCACSSLARQQLPCTRMMHAD